MEIPITQSEAWLALQKDLGTDAVFKKTKSYQYLAIITHTPVGDYLYLPYGPVAADRESFKSALASLLTLAQQKSAMFIRIEPRSAAIAKYLAERGTITLGSTPVRVRKVKDQNPKETWVLRLPAGSQSVPLENRELLALLPSRLLRYYKSRAKNGITIETSHRPADIVHLISLQRALAKEKGISTFSADYLATELSQPFATLYLVKYQPAGATKSEILATGLVFDDATTRYNLQGAQSDAGRRLHATGILTIQLILDAAAKGLTTFDFWGIAPEGAPASHPWAGFTGFKKTFAGHELDFAGTHDLVLHPAKYRLYSALRRVRRLFK